MTNKLIRYVRHPRKKNKIGVVLAYKNNGSISYGWSLTRENMGDRFCREIGMEIALRRALDGWGFKNRKTPHIIRQALKEMEERAKRYFKDGLRFQNLDEQFDKEDANASWGILFNNGENNSVYENNRIYT